MKTQHNAPPSKFPQPKNEEILPKLLESLKKACQAMIDTIEAYKDVTDKRGH